MQIANVEALKAWLTRTMGPICDADPATLAKYVLALIKKDKPESELRIVCLTELEAFLSNKTAEFVDLLFATLKDFSYEECLPKELPRSAKEPTVAEPPVLSSAGKVEVGNSSIQETKVPARENVSTAGASSRGDRRDSLRENVHRSKSRDRNLASQLSSGSRSHRTASRNEEDHRSHASKTYRRRSRNRSRTRSRERRIPISRRLGYRSDLRQRVDSLRGWDDRHPRDDRTYRRRRSRSRRAHSRSRSRSRSKVRSPPRVYSHMRAYSRSRSKSRSRSRSVSPLPNPSSPNAPWSSSRASRSRSRSREGRDEKAYRITMPLDVVLSNSSAAAISERARVMKGMPPDMSKPPPAKARCRDYDEQGLCLLGNLCPYDHGFDPVIVEDVNLPVPAGLITYPGGQPAPVRAFASHSITPLPPVVIRGPQMSLVAPPSVPLISSGPSVLGPHPPAPAPDLLPANVVLDPAISSTVISSASTEMTSVVSVQSAVSRVGRSIPDFPRNLVDGKRVVIPAQREVNLTRITMNRPDFTDVHDARYVIMQAGGQSLGQNLTDRQLPFGRKPVFDPSRLGVRQSAVTPGDNTTLELAGIPTHLNTISAINQEFSRYGTIVNIQVYYNGLADHALVSFAQNAEAAAAFRSSEPFFNNRFVTVSWHSAKQATAPEVRKLSVKERLGTRPVDATNVHQPFANSSQEIVNDDVREQSEKKMITVSPSGALTKTLFNKQLSNNTTKDGENRTAADVESLANHKDLTKEQMKVRLEINKQKQLIMMKQVEKQKALLLKLESQDLSAEEKKSTIEKIKILESQVQKMRSELNDSTKVLRPLVRRLPDTSVKTNTNHLPQEQFKSRAELRKSILDMELDLIAKENQGVDAVDLRKKLAVLKSQAAAQGLSGSRRGTSQPFRGRGGLAGSFAGRGRGRRGPLALAAKLIDRRPKQLLVSGFAPAAVDVVMTTASKFGGIENSKYLPENNCILLTFHSRHDAEKAAIEGLSFRDQNLLMSWFDDRKPTKHAEEKKEEENRMMDDAEEEADAGESAKASEAEKVTLEDSESEVELIVEDDDYKDEELGNSVTMGFDEDVLDESELLRLDEDEDSGANLHETWHRLND